jgi:hypothetical protein
MEKAVTGITQSPPSQLLHHLGAATTILPRLTQEGQNTLW